MTNTLKGAIILQSTLTESSYAQYKRVAPYPLGADQHHPPDLAVLLHWRLDAGIKAPSQRADTDRYADRITHHNPHPRNSGADRNPPTCPHPMVPAYAHAHNNADAHRHTHPHPYGDVHPHTYTHQHSHLHPNTNPHTHPNRYINADDDADRHPYPTHRHTHSPHQYSYPPHQHTHSHRNAYPYVYGDHHTNRQLAITM